MSRASYLFMYDEVTWGTKPGSPDYYFVPILGNYGVKFRPQVRRMQPTIGLFTPKRVTLNSGYPAGNLAMPLYGYIPTGLSDSLAEIFLNWAFANLESCTRPSKGSEWAQHLCEGTDALRRDSGLRVARAKLAGSIETGFVYLEFSLLGKDEESFTPAQTLPTNMLGLKEMRFTDVVFNLGGSPLGISSLELEATFDLKPVMLNSSRPNALRGGTESLKLTVKPLKASDVWDGRLRTEGIYETTASIVLTGSHADTGGGGTTNTVATLTIARAAFVGGEDESDLREIDFQTLEFDILKPDTSAAAIVLAYTEV